ncbi:uncharacterized protein LOC110899373 isoform X2 [Helianthus annuus]|uniref:uncharacterized protein LOC110899373 isoform X2 n=1 Tax=Helianthus annuus TaxID=4232 RepID=UPI000B909B7D|nr:uncharacterized protein LOC110899373 isoform X2 [Helianthus annuus]
MSANEGPSVQAANITEVNGESSVQPITDQNDEAVTPNFYHSPRGTKYWIPNVPTPLKPATGMVFGRWEDAVTLYQDYAQRAGFDIRLSTVARYKGVITHRYIVCSRFGNPNSNTGDSMDVTPASSKQRNSSFKVTDCQACIKLKPVKGTEGYSIYKFIEPHNMVLLMWTTWI